MRNAFGAHKSHLSALEEFKTLSSSICKINIVLFDKVYSEGSNTEELQPSMPKMVDLEDNVQWRLWKFMFVKDCMVICGIITVVTPKELALVIEAALVQLENIAG